MTHTQQPLYWPEPCLISRRSASKYNVKDIILIPKHYLSINYNFLYFVQCVGNKKTKITATTAAEPPECFIFSPQSLTSLDTGWSLWCNRSERDKSLHALFPTIIYAAHALNGEIYSELNHVGCVSRFAQHTAHLCSVSSLRDPNESRIHGTITVCLWMAKNPSTMHVHQALNIFNPLHSLYFGTIIIIS